MVKEYEYNGANVKGALLLAAPAKYVLLHLSSQECHMPSQKLLP